MATGTFYVYEGAVDISASFLAHAAKAVAAQEAAPLVLAEDPVPKGLYLMTTDGTAFLMQVTDLQSRTSLWYYPGVGDLAIPFAMKSVDWIAAPDTFPYEQVDGLGPEKRASVFVSVVY